MSARAEFRIAVSVAGWYSMITVLPRTLATEP